MATEREYIAYAESPMNTWYVVYKSTHRANTKANLEDARKQFEKGKKLSVNFTYSKLTNW